MMDMEGKVKENGAQTTGYSLLITPYTQQEMCTYKDLNMWKLNTFIYIM